MVLSKRVIVTGARVPLENFRGPAPFIFVSMEYGMRVVIT